MFKLRDYQKDGVRFLLENRHCILGDEMGVGKTLQALVASLILLKRKEIDRILVIGTPSILYNWRDELAKFFKRKCYIHHGPKRDFSKVLSSKIVLTTYSTWKIDVQKQEQVLKRNSKGRITRIALPGKTCVVLDEAHLLKNHMLDAHASIRMLGRAYTFLLTGTPIHNSPKDGYGLLSLLDNEIMPYTRWEELFYVKAPVTDSFGNVKYYYNKYRRCREPALTVKSYRNLDLFSDLLTDKMLRRETKQVLKGLPKNTRIEQWYKADSNIRAKEAALERKYEQLNSEDHKMAHLQELLLLSEGVHERELVEDKVKRELLLDVLRESSGRLVVWYNFRTSVDLFSEYLTQLGYDTYIHHGGLGVKARYQNLAAWRDSEKGVLLCTIKATSVGLNLVEANRQVFYGLSYNASDLDQAEARLWRGGQTKPVFTHYLLGKGMIDEAVYHMTRRKKQVAEGIYNKRYFDILDGVSLSLRG